MTVVTPTDLTVGDPYPNKCYLPFILYPPGMHRVPDGSEWLHSHIDLEQQGSGQPVFVPGPTELPAPAGEPILTSLAEYVCDDCAYAETCPNKDQRLPKDCGSFQWR